MCTILITPALISSLGNMLWTFLSAIFVYIFNFKLYVTLHAKILSYLSEAIKVTLISTPSLTLLRSIA